MVLSRSLTAEDVVGAVRNRSEQLVELVQALVRLPSVLGEERDAQDVVANRLDRIGFDVTHIPITGNLDPKDETAGYPPIADDARTNVAAALGSKTAAVVHLSGHIDVVPVEDAWRWSDGAFAARIRDSRIWGRGAGDMKGGLAAYLFAAETLVDLVGRDGLNLVFSSVLDEECGGNGMKAVLSAGYKAPSTLIGEPSGLRLQHAGVGVVWARIIVRGSGSHPAFAASDAESPSEGILRILEALRQLEVRIVQESQDEFFERELPRPFRLNIGSLSGGVWPSSEPTSVSARIRLGFGRDLTPAQVQALVTQTVASIRVDAMVEFEGFRAPAYVHGLDNPLADALRAAHFGVVGEQAGRRVLAGTTDARSILEGDCLCYGPVAGNIHSIDEWVDIESVVRTAEVAALTIAKLHNIVK